MAKRDKQGTLYIAQYESVSFWFEGVGFSEQQARVILTQTIQAHCRDTGAHAVDFYNIEDVQIRKIEPGSGYLDHCTELVREKVVRL